MKTVVHIPRMLLAEWGQSVLRRLAALYPDGYDGHAFWLRLPEGDPRTVTVLAELDCLGFKAWNGLASRQDGKEYPIHLLRDYDASDWDISDYLMLQSAEGTYTVDDLHRTDDGLIRLTPRYLDRGWDLTFTSSMAVVVPDRVRRQVEGGELRGVVFRPTVLEDDRDSEPPVRTPWGTEEFPEPWWELTSDRTLPPMAPSVRKFAPHRVPLPREARDVVSLRDSDDPLMLSMEPHYLASEMDAIGPFDLANSYENLRWPERPWHLLIASNRFYRFFRDNGIRVSWVPVRIDPG